MQLNPKEQLLLFYFNGYEVNIGDDDIDYINYYSYFQFVFHVIFIPIIILTIM